MKRIGLNEIPAIYLVQHVLQYFVTIIFVLCSGLCMSASALGALFLAVLAHVNFWGWECFYDNYKAKERIKAIIRVIVPGAIAIIAFGIVTVIMNSSSPDSGFLSEPLVQKIVNCIIKITAFGFIAPLIIPMTEDTKINDAFYLRFRVLTPLQKKLFKVSSLLFRILVVAGFMLVIFAKLFSGFYFECVVIVGCVVWAFRQGLNEYFFVNCEVKTSDENNSDSANVTSSSNDSKSTKSDVKPISSSKIERIVQNIAKYWSLKSDTFNAHSGTKSIRFSVTGEFISGTIEGWIVYRVSGKLYDIREGDMPGALVRARSCLEKAMYKIRTETEKELKNYDVYPIEIKVEAGEIL